MWTIEQIKFKHFVKLSKKNYSKLHLEASCQSKKNLLKNIIVKYSLNDL